MNIGVICKLKKRTKSADSALDKYNGFQLYGVIWIAHVTGKNWTGAGNYRATQTPTFGMSQLH